MQSDRAQKESAFSPFLLFLHPGVFATTNFIRHAERNIFVALDRNGWREIPFTAVFLRHFYCKNKRNYDNLTTGKYSSRAFFQVVVPLGFI